MHNNILAATFALISALMIAAGTVWRHQLLRAGLTFSEANPAPLTSLKLPMWWLSVVLAFGAYAMQAIALAYGSLLVVQPVLVLSLMFTLVISARVERRPMPMEESMWATLLTICVGALLFMGRPLPGERTAPTWEWVLIIGAGVVISVIIIHAARFRPAPVQALLYGIVCGGVFGFLALFSKVTVDAFNEGGISTLLATWQFWALIASSVLGTVVQQYAFGAGVLSRSLPAMKIVEPLLALSLGWLILGESLQVTGAAGWLVIGISVAGMLVGAGKLARRPVT